MEQELQKILNKYLNPPMNKDKKVVERSKWLVLEDDGWRIVMPETDILPHSTDPEGEERELAYASCPCKPKVSYEDLMVVHNSFAEKKAVDDAINP